MNILADASLPGLIKAFPAPFSLTLYKNNDEVPNLLKNQDILLCRATLRVDHRLLNTNSLRYVATASSGSDNLDQEFLKTKNIISIDAKGCNAISVADYVMSCLGYLDTKYYLQNKKIGVIGLGHVGAIVNKRLKLAGFELRTFDPIKALTEHEFKSCRKEELFECEVLCIHAELHNRAIHPSLNLIDKHFLSQLKSGCIIINAARGGIVNEDALLNEFPRLLYCTDVFFNEPHINPEIIDKSILCTPHIAGHSIEAKYAAVRIVSQKIHALLGLALPSYASPILPNDNIENYDSWQKASLALYNPIYETSLLKQSLEIESTFLTLRKKHIHRHNFNAYINKSTNSSIKQIFD
jgi:erythronate-4-phosphate dehydrogenase